jgi:hypothetical protein
MLDQTDIQLQLREELTISPTINLGLPEAIVTWSRSNLVLDASDPRVTISGDGMLRVTDVQASDRGVYTVTASNSALPRGATSSVNVFINCKLNNDMQCCRSQ